jgi:hypothetical protein
MLRTTAPIFPRSNPALSLHFLPTSTLSPGLHHKLHGTHHPNSTEKTVIKRRKRVPAASDASASTNVPPSVSTRLTEQAAAEALVSVSRSQDRASGEDSDGAGAEDGDGDDDGPRRRRARRGANGNPPASLARRRSAARAKVSTRRPTPEDKDEAEDDVDTGSKRQKGSQRDILLAESRAGSLSRSSSHAAFHIDRYGRGHTADSPSLHSTSHVGGFDLPPLNAVLAALETSHMVLNGSRAFFPTSAGYVGPPRTLARAICVAKVLLRAALIHRATLTSCRPCTTRPLASMAMVPLTAGLPLPLLQSLRRVSHQPTDRFRRRQRSSYNNRGAFPTPLQRPGLGSHLTRTRWPMNRTTPNPCHFAPVSARHLTGG